MTSTMPALTRANAIGQPLDRVDGRLKVTGGARYSAEMPVDNLAYAVLVTSEIASGRIAAIDTDAAEATPGVLAVLTHLNAPQLTEPAQVPRRLNLLQSDTVAYSNQPIGIVIAESFEAATWGAAQVRPTYQTSPARLTLEGELPNLTAPRNGGDYSRGDVTAGLAAAEVQVSQTYTTPMETHNPLEPHATIAAWEGDRLTLYDSTQGIFNDRRNVANWLGIAPENVRVVSYFVGGGFGCKGTTWSHVVLAAMAARAAGRPVKLVLKRGQMFGPVGFRSETRQTVTLGAKRDGTLTAIRHSVVSQTSVFDEFVEQASVVARMMYAAPNAETSQRLVKLNTGTPTFMRAPGEATGSFAQESAMDELAYALNLDPIELRLRNYAETDPQTGKPWSSKSLRECYRQGADKFGWSARAPRPGSMRDGNTLIGYGMASATYPARRQPASARAMVRADGTALVVSGSQDIGTGTYTVMAQVAADALGLPFARVRFELGDTRLPDSPNSGGSVTAASVSTAVHEAATALRLKLTDLAINDDRSPLAGATADDIDIDATDGRLYLKADPSRGETYAALLQRQGLDTLDARVDSKPGDEAQKYAGHSFGAHFAEVRVDPDLGEVRVSRLLGAYGVGRVLNAKTARSQMIGGMVWGMGMALHEHTVLDPRLGRIINADLAEYHVPVNADVPPIDVIFVDEHDPYINPVGVKGIGEVGITGVAAAIANAIFHATGKRVRDLPITLDKLL